MSEDEKNVLGHPSQHLEPGDIYPWTFKAILANAVFALIRIAAALERIDLRQRKEERERREAAE